MFSFSFILVITIAAVPVPLWAWQLHHRVLHPSLPESPFLNRASILSDAGGNLRIHPAPSLQSDFDSFVETAHVTDALYQLALDPHPGQSTSLWLTSSVKAVISFPPSPPYPSSSSFSTQCHLINAANENIVLHVPHPGGAPFALDYFLDTAPSDGTCPPSKASGLNLALPHNVTITLSLPRQPPLFVVIYLTLGHPHAHALFRPQLRVPPPLTPTGDPVVHEPEKTFLQKYWLYIVIALGALSAFTLLPFLLITPHPLPTTSVMAPGPPEEGPQGS